MKKISIILLTLTISISAFSQTEFKPGYYINANNERLNCELRNHGNDNIGEDYVIKYSTEDKVEQVNIEEVKEFGIDGSYSFVRSHIRIDISPSIIQFAKDTINHEEVETGHVFLKQIIASESASLYSFQYEGEDYFFYQLGDSNIELLVYKRYIVGNSSVMGPEILENNTYKDQLRIDLPLINGNTSLTYNEKSLSKYFKKYNTENGTSSYNYSKKKEGKLNFFLSTSYNTYSFYSETADIQGTSFDNSTSLGYGIEVQYVVGENRNKWGVFAETSYSKASFHVDEGYGSMYGLDYESIQIPIGLLYNFNLTDKMKIQLKAGIVQNIAINETQVYFFKPANIQEINPRTNGMVSASLSYGIVDVSARIYSTNIFTDQFITEELLVNTYSIRLGIKVF